MEYPATITVLGAKSSKGDFNGRPYDSTTIFYQAKLQDGENFVGQIGEQIRWGTSANFEKIKGLKFPLVANVLMEQVSNGKTVITIMKDLVPQVQAQK